MDTKKSEKKFNFEEQTKEELVKKCQSFLTIIQKAKLGKVTLEQENANLKAQLEKNQSVTDELITNLTEEKLRMVNTIDGLKNENKKLSSEKQSIEAQLEVSQNENISFKRQINRLTEENDQLLADMESLEKESKNTDKIVELENMLKVSLDEVVKLKTEKESLDPNVSITSYNSDSDQSISLTERNEKLRNKLKTYHDKIIKLANNIRTLKEDKNEIIDQFKTYTNQVKEWKDKLNLAARKIIKCMEDLEKENEALKSKVQQLKDANARILDQLETHKTDDEKSKDREEVETLKMRNIQLLEENKNLDETINRNAQLMDKLIQERDDLFAEIKETSRKLKDDLNTQKTENREQKITIENYEKMIEIYKKEIAKLESDNLSRVEENDNLKSSVTELKSKLVDSDRDLQNNITTEQKLAEMSGEEIIKLVEEVKLLKENNESLRERLRLIEPVSLKSVDADIQTEVEYVPLTQLEERVMHLKTENAQLLSEMNEMNQALKERGEKNSKLEAHCEEVIKKLQAFETQSQKKSSNIIEKDEQIKELTSEINALKIINKNVSLTEKDEEINRLKSEIDSLKEKVTEYTTENDNMSSSTISRSDELNRIKDLEGSWEERYGKLRNLALKLKAKIKEQTAELETLKNHNSKTDLELQITELKKEKSNTELWKKQIALKVQALRKELEEKDVKIKKLLADNEIKDVALKTEVEKHQQTRSSLQQSTNEIKKNSVLSLEMEDYEKSVKELSAKLERKQEHITKLKTQVDSQKTVVSALRDQINILEDKLKSNASELESALNETLVYKKKVNELDSTVSIKDEEIRNLKQLLETVRSQNEELSTEMSKDLAEHRKLIDALRDEKENLVRQNANLQQGVRELQQRHRLKVEEFDAVSREFETYKVRAQSVLRQNQSRDIGLEEKLAVDVTALKSRVETLQLEIKDVRDSNDSLKKQNEALKSDKTILAAKYDEISNEIMEANRQYNQLLTKHNQALNDHNETIRSLKVHTETLAQCYRQQLQDQEVRHNREIVELQSRIEKAPAAEAAPPAPIPSTPREEGEGSESIGGAANNHLYPVPLEKLLGDDDEQQLNAVKKQVGEQESKIVYLTELLADTEQDLAKHVQMNKVLKEEIRRQQRAVEREKHAENLEYLKNVVFKFVTLNSGDERTRLVPVLNTILKLSPEETQKLNSVAKGDPGFKAWSYLPGWSPKQT